MKKSNLFCRLSVGFHPSSSSSSSGECHQSVCSRPRCRPDISYQDILYQIFCFQDIPRQMTDILSSRYPTPDICFDHIVSYPAFSWYPDIGSLGCRYISAPESLLQIYIRLQKVCWSNQLDQRYLLQLTSWRVKLRKYFQSKYSGNYNFKKKYGLWWYGAPAYLMQSKH